MVFRSWLWSRWECPQCGAELEFDFGRRTVVTVLGGVFGIGPAMFFGMADMWWAVLAALCIYTVIWSFDSVRLRHPTLATGVGENNRKHLG